jgi:anthranilate synthase/aminodeoxychorismate synthase-like glutamine amidotransferase
MKKILLLDNHDSFTYNLAELLRNHGKVTFNIIQPEDLIFEEVKYFDKLLFSPGPGVPDEHPVMFQLLESFHRTKPILGICLGHQAIGAFFGAGIENLDRVIHGQQRKLTLIDPDHYLFQGIENNTEVGLYHSWVVGKEKFPEILKIIALSKDGLIMAIAHKTYDICGLQFHPESIISINGQKMIDNWINHS